jgi:hypothetical protein
VCHSEQLEFAAQWSDARSIPDHPICPAAAAGPSPARCWLMSHRPCKSRYDGPSTRKPARAPQREQSHKTGKCPPRAPRAPRGPRGGRAASQHTTPSSPGHTVCVPHSAVLYLTPVTTRDRASDAQLGQLGWAGSELVRPTRQTLPRAPQVRSSSIPSRPYASVRSRCRCPGKCQRAPLTYVCPIHRIHRRRHDD